SVVSLLGAFPVFVFGCVSLFAVAVFFQVFTSKSVLIFSMHVWTAIVGSNGLTDGMWLRSVKPFGIEGAFPLIFFIVGGTILLISFVCFVLLTFMKMEAKK